MDEIPTELWAVPVRLLPAIRKFLGECPHDRVAGLCAGMDAIRRVEGASAKDAAPPPAHAPANGKAA